MKTRHWMLSLASALATSLCMTACSPDASHEVVASNAPRHPVQQHETAAAAQRHGGSALFHWSERGSGLPPADRAYLAQLSSRYHNIFADLDGRSLREVRALGFPTAQEWLEARQLSDEELKADADGGNLNAKIFYTDRRLMEIERLVASLEADSILDVFRESPELRAQHQQQVIDTHVSAAGLLKFHPTPFTAYLFGVSSAVTGGEEFPIPASMKLAADLGDTRAPALLRDYSRHVGEMDANAVASSYSSMRAIAGSKGSP